MIKLFLITLLTSLLFSQDTNPKVYSALGNVIYDNVTNISKLKSIPIFKKQINKIKKYTVDVTNTKRLGFAVMSDNNVTKRLGYLSKLRELSKVNDSFVRDVKNNFKYSIVNKDNELFIALVNSGLLDIKLYKKEIMDYYVPNRDDINSSGIIQNYLDADLKLIKRRDKYNKKKSDKEQKKLAKIKRIRAKDLAQQEAIKKALEEDVANKKAKILKEQKRELGIKIK